MLQIHQQTIRDRLHFFDKLLPCLALVEGHFVEVLFDVLSVALFAQSLFPVDLVDGCFDGEPPIILLVNASHHEFFEAAVSTFVLPFEVEDVVDVVEDVVGFFVVLLEAL